MSMVIRADSLEYVTATITTDTDITGDVIQVATPVSGADPETWFATTVLGVVKAPTGGLWTATYRLLMGPGGDITLTAGKYDWLCKLTDSPEIPVRYVDTFTVK